MSDPLAELPAVAGVSDRGVPARYAWAIPQVIVWLPLLAQILLEMILLPRSSLTVIIGPLPFVIPGILISCAVLTAAVGGHRERRVAELFDVLALLLLMPFVHMLFEFYSLSLRLPLVSARLDAADRFLGFSWTAYYRFIIDHPTLAGLTSWAYWHFTLQAIIIADTDPPLSALPRIRLAHDHRPCNHRWCLAAASG